MLTPEVVSRFESVQQTYGTLFALQDFFRPLGIQSIKPSHVEHIEKVQSYAGTDTAVSTLTGTLLPSGIADADMHSDDAHNLRSQNQ